MRAFHDFCTTVMPQKHYFSMKYSSRRLGNSDSLLQELVLKLELKKNILLRGEIRNCSPAIFHQVKIRARW